VENKIIENTSFTEYEARIKLLVLFYSVIFEKLSSQFLIKKLGLDESAISFGNTSKSLSFNQKINLLLDSKLLDKDYKKYIDTFFEIRNQFLHNSEVKSLKDCISLLNGKERFMEKAYREKKERHIKLGGEIAEKEIQDELKNEKDLLLFDIDEEEKKLYKYWISLSEDVIIGFRNMLSNIITPDMGDKK